MSMHPGFLQHDWWNMDTVSSHTRHEGALTVLCAGQDAAGERRGYRRLRPAAVLDLLVAASLGPGGAAAHQPAAAQQHDRGSGRGGAEVPLQDVSPGQSEAAGLLVASSPPSGSGARDHALLITFGGNGMGFEHLNSKVSFLNKLF